MIDRENHFVQTCGISLDSFDSEVISLVADLGLVLKGSVEYLAFITALENSCFSKHPFCERYHDHLRNISQNRDIVCRLMYQTYRSGSRYKHESQFVCAPALFPFEKP